MIGAESAGAETAPRPIRIGVIAGATGAGKTAAAIGIAERIGAEIVNADSRQFYRGMDIGTAKPDARERARVPHHLIDVRTPAEPIDVAEFAGLARAAIADIAGRGRRALVVGGSGLYLRVLCGGIFAGPAASAEIRGELTDLAARHGAAGVHALLREVDGEAAARISPNDLKRTMRALEVFRLTGVTISEHQRRHRFAARDYETVTVGLALARETLYETIDRRFDRMIADGLVAEVRTLMAAGYDPGAPPLCAIGYAEIAAYLRGECALAEAAERARRNSRRLAKRQLTWFRADPAIRWVDGRAGIGEALRIFAEFFSRG
jgi:tRNA dimethylallyltransferase